MWPAKWKDKFLHNWRPGPPVQKGAVSVLLVLNLRQCFAVLRGSKRWQASPPAQRRCSSGFTKTYLPLALLLIHKISYNFCPHSAVTKKSWEASSKLIRAGPQDTRGPQHLPVYLLRARPRSTESPPDQTLETISHSGASFSTMTWPIWEGNHATEQK